MSDITFTLDLEDHRPDDDAELRFPAITDSLLDDLDSWGTIGTFFVVGDVARSHPDLVARVAARGHEIALHGSRHVALHELGEAVFRTELVEAQDLLSQIAQQPITGFRAPIFSLVPDSAWAPSVLGEHGFTYSSSVLPARNPLYGWPGAPRDPFLWPDGLVELPCPVFGFGPLSLPLLGGTYLRISPRLVTRRASRHVSQHSAPWLYAHPYDFDPSEKRWVVPEVGRFGSRVLWWRRSSMRARVKQLVSGSVTTMSDLAASLSDLPTFDPTKAAP